MFNYLQIIGGTSAAIAAAGIVSDNTMWCGRNFATLTDEDGATTTAAGTSVCSKLPIYITHFQGFSRLYST